MKDANETGAGPSSSLSRTPANNETEAQDFGGLRHENQHWDRLQHESSDVDARNIRHDEDDIEVEKTGSPTDDDFSSSSGSISEHELRSGRSSHSGRPEVARTVSHVRDGIETRHDVEAALPLEQHPTPRHLADPNLVTWNTDDPENPKTWETGQKWAAVFVVSTFTLISPVSSTMTAPALGSIASELNITNEFEKQLSLSIFVLGKSLSFFRAAPAISPYTVWRTASKEITRPSRILTHDPSICDWSPPPWATERVVRPRHRPPACEPLLSLLQPRMWPLPHKSGADSFPVSRWIRRVCSPRHRWRDSFRPVHS